jgi:TetR/AcrR family transcriptional regulator, regulator of cefoperazone and chloramphenicol sensitivity
LKHLVSLFYEDYLKVIEQALNYLEKLGHEQCFEILILSILNYQHERRQLTRFIYRETTIDSTIYSFFLREH